MNHRMHDVVAKKVLAVVAWSMAISCLCSCAPEINVRSVRNLNKQYEEKLLRWTRGDRIYYNIDRVLFIYATYLTPEFRQDFKNQYVSFFNMNPEKIDTDLEMVATSKGQGQEFFVYADTPDFGWNDLDEKDSTWRVSLWNAASPSGVDPIVVRKFSGRGPNVREFFPFMNDFGQAYLVVFPLRNQDGAPEREGDTDLSIKVSSALGTAVMSWKVAR